MGLKQPDVSERLAHTHAMWLQHYLTYEVEVAIRLERGEVSLTDMELAKNGRKLANTILDKTIQSLTPIDWVPIPKLVRPRSVGHTLHNVYGYFPLELFEWNRTSRRVFHIPHSLTAMLASAKFPDMCWSDIQWPYDSFIITLEKPLVIDSYESKKESYDTIMISRLPILAGGGDAISLRLLQRPTQSGATLGMSQRDMERFDRLMKKRLFERALYFSESRRLEFGKYYPTVPGACGIVFLDHLESDTRIHLELDSIPTTIGTIEANFPAEHMGEEQALLQQKLEISMVAMRIAVGWMCYLETLSSDSTTWRQPTGHNRKIGEECHSAVITEPGHICDIIGKGRIDQKEVTSVSSSRNSQGFVRPHWRRAHKRRPIGSPPGSEKSLRIPPKLVREDLVPLYGIIGGTKTTIIFEE
jgi:hypothetical protein